MDEDEITERDEWDQTTYSAHCMVEMGVITPEEGSWVLVQPDAVERVEAISAAVHPSFINPTIENLITTSGVIANLRHEYDEERKKIPLNQRLAISLSALDDMPDLMNMLAGSAARTLGEARAKAMGMPQFPDHRFLVTTCPSMEPIPSDDLLYDHGNIQNALDACFSPQQLLGMRKQIERLRDDVIELELSDDDRDPRQVARDFWAGRIVSSPPINIPISTYFTTRPLKITCETNKKQRQRRKVIRKSVSLAEKVLGRHHTSLFIKGSEIVLGGVLYDFVIRKHPHSSLASNGHGQVQVIVRRAGGTDDLASLCVYFDDTPVMDQIIGLALMVQSGQEDEILQTANLTRIHPNKDDPDLVELYEFAGKRLVASFNIADIIASHPMELEWNHTKEEIAARVKPAVLSYIINTVLADTPDQVVELVRSSTAAWDREAIEQLRAEPVLIAA